jgi:hypothetical protein
VSGLLIKPAPIVELIDPFWFVGPLGAGCVVVPVWPEPIVEPALPVDPAVPEPPVPADPPPLCARAMAGNTATVAAVVRNLRMSISPSVSMV